MQLIWFAALEDSAHMGRTEELLLKLVQDQLLSKGQFTHIYKKRNFFFNLRGIQAVYMVFSFIRPGF